MPELRQNPITKHWTAVAVERSKRPDNFQHEPEPDGGFDPFAVGGEDKTPSELYAVRKPGTKKDEPGWDVRVIPNLFPIVAGGGKLRPVKEGIYTRARGIGAHELVITDDATLDEANMSEQQLVEIIDTFKKRYLVLKENKEIEYVQIFKNHKGKAGASLRHPHHQIVGLPFVSNDIREEVDGARAYRREKKKVALLDIIASEKRSKKRVIYENKDFIVFCPYFSENPFETWIAPKAPRPYFEKITEEEMKSFADALQCLLGKMWNTLDNPPFNYFLHTAPCDEKSHPYYQWHLTMFPRLTTRAGFELGTGVIVNVVAPEDAAKFLRKAARKPKPLKKK